MEKESIKQFKLFYCYAREDRALRDELDTHLSMFRHQGLITSWSDREISPGSEWKEAIDTQLNSADLILLLVSADFMASDYCYGIEMKRALERHAEGTARVIPIILRRVSWEGAPFSTLQILPTDAKPVTQWHDRDEAFWNVAQGIQKVLKELMSLSKTEKEWEDEGNALYDLKCYDEALFAYDHAISLNPNNADFWHHKGTALYSLKRYDEALSAYEQAIQLNSSNADFLHDKSVTLLQLQRYDEALSAYDKAIQLAPDNAHFWHDKGETLWRLKRYDAALSAYEQATRLDPNNSYAWHDQGATLSKLKCYDKALSAFNQAILLDPDNAHFWHDKGIALSVLKRYDEALSAFNQATLLAPNNALDWKNKGYVLLQLKRYKEATQAYIKAYLLGLATK